MTRAFTYAHGIESRWKRMFVKGVEAVTGRGRLGRLYDEFRVENDGVSNVWDRCVNKLGVDLDVQGDITESIPEEGPVVVVANHPFGVVDGIVICHLVNKVRPDHRILINDVLAGIEDIRPYLLPIDFRETKEAVATNLRSRANAKKFLQQGGVVIVFPSGGVSTARNTFGPAVDDTWKPFTAKLVQQTGADVVPLFFHGQNGRLFQWASRVSLTLRLSLLINETRKRIGSSMRVTVGDRIPHQELAAVSDRERMMAVLRETTYALGGSESQRRLVAAPLSA